MPDRRDTLKTLATLTVLPATAAAAQAPHSHAAAPAPTNPPEGPRFFTITEIAQLAIWTDHIIPRTETPGAADAGVPLLIDRLCQRNDAVARSWRSALSWLESQPGDRVALLERISKERDTAGARAFKLLKDSTIDLYYSTREGLQVELGWNANTFLSEFKGCTHPEHQK